MPRVFASSRAANFALRRPNRSSSEPCSFRLSSSCLRLTNKYLDDLVFVFFLSLRPLRAGFTPRRQCPQAPAAAAPAPAWAAAARCAQGGGTRRTAPAARPPRCAPTRHPAAPSPRRTAAARAPPCSSRRGSAAAGWVLSQNVHRDAIHNRRGRLARVAARHFQRQRTPHDGNVAPAAGEPGFVAFGGLRQRRDHIVVRAQWPRRRRGRRPPAQAVPSAAHAPPARGGARQQRGQLRVAAGRPAAAAAAAAPAAAGGCAQEALGELRRGHPAGAVGFVQKGGRVDTNCGKAG